MKKKFGFLGSQKIFKVKFLFDFLKLGLWVCLSMDNGQNKLQTISPKNVAIIANNGLKMDPKHKCG